MRGWARWLCVAAASATAVGYLILPPPPLDRSRVSSVLVLAADGSILRGFLSADGKWRLPVELGRVEPLYRRMLVAAEDARFEWHPGVDPLAMLRASVQLALNRHIVSGASTLTMQVARLLEHHPRSFSAKLGEMAKALALERRLSKDQLLDLYLDLAPFGGNLEGVRAASLASARSRPTSRRHSALCWSRSRARRNACVPTGTLKRRVLAATAFFPAWPKPALSRLPLWPKRAWKTYRGSVSPCRFGRRIWRAC